MGHYIVTGKALSTPHEGLLEARPVGTIFDADFDEDTEAGLIAAGMIAVKAVPRKPEAREEPKQVQKS